MGTKKLIKIVDIVGSILCIASEDGEKVYREIASSLRSGGQVILSFEGVEDLTSAFLNTAIGQLYSGEFPEELIKGSLILDKDNINGDGLFLIKRVVDRAKEFFKDQDRHHAITREVMGDDKE